MIPLIRKLTCNIVQHAQIQQRVREPQYAASNYWRPVGSLSIGGKSEPEKRDREQPYCHQRSKEPCFRTALATPRDAVSLEQVRLNGHEDEHDRHTHNKVEIGEICTNVPIVYLVYCSPGKVHSKMPTYERPLFTLKTSKTPSR